MNLKDLIKDNVARFSHASEGILFYNIGFEGSTYQFSIDMNNSEDVGVGVFNSEERAIFLMRWIRRAMESDTFVKIK